MDLSATMFSLFIIAFTVLPPYQPVTAENMNCASAVLAAVLIASGISWHFSRRKIFKGPGRDAIEDAMENADMKRIVQ